MPEHLQQKRQKKKVNQTQRLVFSCFFLKETTETTLSTDLKVKGGEFQSLGATVAKVMSPLVLSHATI